MPLPAEAVGGGVMIALGRTITVIFVADPITSDGKYISETPADPEMTRRPESGSKASTVLEAITSPECSVCKTEGLFGSMATSELELPGRFFTSDDRRELILCSSDPRGGGSGPSSVGGGFCP